MTYRKLISLTLCCAASLLSAATAAGISQFPDMDKYLGRGRYASAPKAFTYMADGSNYVQLSADGKKIVKYDTRTGKEMETVLDLDNTRETVIDRMNGFKFSPEGTKILVWKNAKSIYRRSFDAEYYVYEIRSRLLKPLSTDHPRQQAPLFSPDATV